MKPKTVHRYFESPPQLSRLSILPSPKIVQQNLTKQVWNHQPAELFFRCTTTIDPFNPKCAWLDPQYWLVMFPVHYCWIILLTPISTWGHLAASLKVFSPILATLPSTVNAPNLCIVTSDSFWRWCTCLASVKNGILHNNTAATMLLWKLVEKSTERAQQPHSILQGPWVQPTALQVLTEVTEGPYPLGDLFWKMGKWFWISLG